MQAKMKRFTVKPSYAELLRKINPILFDVSLRDGIQSANPQHYDTQKKMNLLSTIYQKYGPPKMEIGAFVSPNALPIMADTTEILDYTNSEILDGNLSTEAYVLVPNKVGLLSAIYHGARNFSFITSVSNEFQLKNTKRDLDYTKKELKEMMRVISAIDHPCKTKLYVSCINQCPVVGPIDPDFIVNDILKSYALADFECENNQIDEICLSDTMGALDANTFEYIVDGLVRFGLDKSRISVHLHVNVDNAKDASRILRACFRRGINRFDVSAVKEGGCSVSLNPSQLKPNLTYEFFYLMLEDYISDPDER